MTWQCWRLRPHLVDFATGTLAGRDRGRVQQHLDGCVRCTTAVAALVDTFRTNGGWVAITTTAAAGAQAPDVINAYADLQAVAAMS